MTEVDDVPGRTVHVTLRQRRARGLDAAEAARHAAALDREAALTITTL